ncbi:uncharacterized protein LOC34621890 [Cyclospora cayetanensis]|uniref:Uncharacterized protein LOC34621890 n=1 Tax=Cyclospora cayetanensis TaxID=88456 RepID=A0A6P6RTP4_9EIME|nr:uncharacterized protein LOC34621890 [Cyclospora cayetanensis]
METAQHSSHNPPILSLGCHSAYMKRQQLKHRLLAHCFHSVARDDATASSAEPAEARGDPVGEALPLSTQQAASSPRANESRDCCDSPTAASTDGASASDTTAPHVSDLEGSRGHPASQSTKESVKPCGRRRRFSRASRSTASACSSSKSRSNNGGCKAVGGEDEKAGIRVLGRVRGRAARNCLRATAAWLGALLPQGASAAVPGDSAAAAIALLARGGRRGRAAVPPGLGGGTGTVSPQHGAVLQQAAHVEAQRGMAGTSEAQSTEDVGAAAAAAPAATSDTGTDTVAGSTENTGQVAATPPLGRRRQGNVRVPLGSPGAASVSGGGAIDFQFPVLFNVAIKRLLKPLLRRAGQPRRRVCSRVSLSSASSVAGTAGMRSSQRPPLPPRVLLRSWRPLSRAQSFGGPRQYIRARQQQHQIVQEQIQQEMGAAAIEEPPQGTLEHTKAVQQQEGTAPLVAEQTTQDGDQLPQQERPEEATSSGSGECRGAASDVLDFQDSGSELGVQDQASQRVTGPPKDATSATGVQQARQEEDEQKQQQKQQAQAQQAASLETLPCGSTVSPRGAVGRGASRVIPPRQPLRMCFLRERIARLYGRLRYLLAPYCASISEWTYNNGNVVVTVGSLLSLTATLMADMRLLRTFNLLAGLCYFSYNWSRRPRLTDAALWNIVFLVLNTVMLWRVHTEHREVVFSSDELDIFQRYFLPAGMSPRQFRRLLRQGTWRTLPQGYVLQAEGNTCSTLCFVARGAVDISQGGETVETYRGGETGAVVGVEPFLSYIAALRKRTAKSATPAAAPPPETFASHADESPDGLHRHQQKPPAATEAQVPPTPHAEQQQQGIFETGAATNNSQATENTTNDSKSSAESCASAPSAPYSNRQEQQHIRAEMPIVETPAEGANAGTVLRDEAASNMSKKDAGEEALCGNSIVAAAAEAAATAAAAVRTVAATALSTETLQNPEAPKCTESPTTTSVVATDLTESGVAGAVGGAREVSTADVGAAAATAGTSGAVVTNEAGMNKPPGVQRGQLLQLLQERGAAPKGAGDGIESPREDGGVTAPFTATCITEATVFALDLKEFAAFVLREPENLGFPVVQGLTTLLVNRSKAQAARLALHSYDAFLAGVFADGVVQTDERKMLEEFRRKRAISQAQHEQALARLGWTPEEFERGSQRGTGIFSRIAVGLGALVLGSQDAEDASDIGLKHVHQDNSSNPIQLEATTPRAPPPIFEDWEIVEDARAVPPHQVDEGQQCAATHIADLQGATCSTHSLGDAVSYTFEAEANAPA